METTGRPPVVFRIKRLVLPFLLPSTGCRGFVIFRGSDTLPVPGFLGVVSHLLLLVLYVRLGLQEKGIERGWCFYAHSLGKSLRGRSPRSSRYFFMLSVVGTWTASLLKRSMYTHIDSSLPCMISSSEAFDLGCRREVVKCLENIFPSCFHEVMASSGRRLYHAIAPFLRVVEKSLHLIAPLTSL